MFVFPNKNINNNKKWYVCSWWSLWQTLECLLERFHYRTTNSASLKTTIQIITNYLYLCNLCTVLIDLILEMAACNSSWYWSFIDPSCSITQTECDNHIIFLVAIDFPFVITDLADEINMWLDTNVITLTFGNYKIRFISLSDSRITISVYHLHFFVSIS